MNIYIGFDGRQGQRISESLYDWLPGVSSAFDPFVRTRIMPGGLPADEADRQGLKNSQYGVLCVTGENVAGSGGRALCEGIPALAGELSTCTKQNSVDGIAHVTPLLYDVETSQLPAVLERTVSVPCSREGIFTLLSSINSLCHKVYKEKVRQQECLLESVVRPDYLTYDELSDVFSRKIDKLIEKLHIQRE